MFSRVNVCLYRNEVKKLDLLVDGEVVIQLDLLSKLSSFFFSVCFTFFHFSIYVLFSVCLFLFSLFIIFKLCLSVYLSFSIYLFFNFCLSVFSVFRFNFIPSLLLYIKCICRCCLHFIEFCSHQKTVFMFDDRTN